MFTGLLGLSVRRRELFERLIEGVDVKPTLDGEITAEEDAIDASDAELDGLLAEYEDAQETLTDRATDYAAMIVHLEAEVEGIKAIVRHRYMAVAGRLERRAERLRERLLFGMQLADVERIATPLGTVRDHTSQRCIIHDETKIPDVYMRIRREPMKDPIKKALQAGHDVPGASVDEHHSLIIR